MKAVSQMEVAGPPLELGTGHERRSDVVREATSSPGLGGVKSRFFRTLEGADRLFSSMGAWRVGLLSGGFVLVVGWADSLAPKDITFSLFYLAPVAFAAWYSTRNLGLIISLLITGIWLAAEVKVLPGYPLSILLLNSVLRFLMLGFVSVIVAKLRSLQIGLKKEVRRALDQLESEVSRRLDMELEIAAASHREQQRIAYDLHDGLGQELGGLAFQSKLLASKLAESGSSLVHDAERVVRMLNQSIGRTRALSRLLDPVGNDSGSLRDAISQLVDYSGEAFAIACTFSGPATLPSFSREADLHLYRIAQEAIRNAVEHGQATEVSVTMELQEKSLCLSIVDNGKGLRSSSPPPPRGRGMGLRIMKYRASALGATLEINSRANAGSRVTCVVPLPGPKLTL